MKYIIGLTVIDVNTKFPVDLNNENVDSHKVFEFIQGEFDRNEKDAKCFVISGFPRTANDAHDFEKYVIVVFFRLSKFFFKF